MVVEPFAPPPRCNRAKENGVGISGVGAENPGDTNGHPVGEPITVLLARTDEPEVLGDSLDSAEDTHGDGEVGGGLGDGDAGHGDSSGNSLPGSDGGSSEGADISGVVAGSVDARVGRHEEDEDTRGKEDGDDSTHGLSVELQLGGSLEEKTNSEVADKRVGDISGTGSNVTGDKVDSLGVLDGEVVLGDTTVDKLGSLGGSSKRSTVGDGATIDGHESEDDTEDTGKESKTSVHVELDLTDDHGKNESSESTSDPDPSRDLVLSGSKVLNTTVGIGLGSLLSEPSVAVTASLESVVDGASGLVDGELDTVPDNLSVEEELNERVDHEDHDTGPEHPVSGRGNVVGVIDTSHDAESSDAFPLTLTDGDTNALTIVDEERTDETPGDDGTTPPRDSSVETDEDTGAEEGGSELDVPTPVLRLKKTAGGVSRPDVEPGEDVPIVKNTIGILSNADDEQSNNESNTQRLDLSQRISCTRSNSVHGSNGHSSSSRRREDEVELPRDIDDEESSEGNSSEEAEEGADKGDGEDATKVLLGVVGEQVETVHGGETGDEDTGHATGAGGSGLDDGVLLGTEFAAEDGDVREGLCEHEDEAVTEDGAEHGSGEGETSLEAEIDVGGVDERTKNDTDNDSTHSQRVRLMLNTLCRRKAREQVDDTIIFAVGLRLEVRVEMRLLLIIARLRGLIVARLEGILGQTLGDDCFGDHDGRSVAESNETCWHDWMKPMRELGSSDLFISPATSYKLACVYQWWHF